jgi:error-prone DNA polymerase
VTPPFATLEDFVTRCPLTERSLTKLVEAGAFDSLGLSRRTTLWEALRLSRTPELPLSVEREQQLPKFTQLSLAEAISWDYQASHHSTRGHPMQHLRESLRQRRMPTATEVRNLKHGTRIDYAGLVICRQRPGTANGVTFMTLEDETGFVNLVVWQDTFAKFSVIARTVSFLGVTGRLQVESNVVHLVAEKLWVPKLANIPLQRASRDFH